MMFSAGFAGPRIAAQIDTLAEQSAVSFRLGFAAMRVAPPGSFRVSQSIAIRVLSMGVFPAA
jgi:hypothetical protein